MVCTIWRSLDDQDIIFLQQSEHSWGELAFNFIINSQCWVSRTTLQILLFSLNVWKDYLLDVLIIFSSLLL